MKKILLFAIGLASISLTSCQDFLDVKSESNYATDSYFENDKQAANSVSKLYQVLNGEDFYSQNLHWEEMAGNVLVAARLGDAGDYIGKMNTMKYDGNTGALKSIYKKSYEEMAQANWVIQSLLNKEKSNVLTYVENRTLGEAYFFRGFYHLLIAYRYGCKSQGVPFVAYEDVEGGYKNTIPPQLKSVTDNFEKVVSDFTKAAEYLPSINEYDTDEKGRASIESAVAMRVRANAFWATWDASRWDKVIEDVTTLEKMGRGLATLDEIYSEEPSDYFNKEYCFGIPGKGGAVYGGGFFPMVAAPFGPFGCTGTNTNAWGEFYTSYDLYEEMLKDGDGNARMKASIIHAGEEITIFGQKLTVRNQYDDGQFTGFFLHKWNKALSHADFITAGYIQSGGECQSSSHCFHIIRFAECLLFRAEAYLVKGNYTSAAADINAVRERSGLKKVDSGTWTALYHERRCELCFEGAPYVYNLKRWALSENTSAPSEIRTLAKKELETTVTFAIWDQDASGKFSGKINRKYQPTGVYDSGEWADYKICLPYSSEELDKSAGQYNQNPNY